MSNKPSLFHSRTLTKALTSSSSLNKGEIPAKAKTTLQKWHDLIESGQIKNHKESNLEASFTSEICVDVLGYKPVTKKIELTNKEQHLNQAGYDLFGLNQEEISLLEDSLR